MDTFNEQLVVRKNSGKDILKVVIYLLLIFLVPGVFVLLGLSVNFYFIVVAACAFFFAIYASFYLVTGLYTEYEYAVTNSNITVDKIVGKRSRKRIISVDIKRFSTLAKLKDSDTEKKSYRKIFRASITPDGDDVFAAEMHLDKFGGECLLLFSPDQKTLEAMQPTLRNNIRLELRKSGLIKPAPKAAVPAEKSTEKPVAKKPVNKQTDKADENPVKKTDDNKTSSPAEKTADTADKKPENKVSNGSKPNNNRKKSKKKS